MAVEQEVQGRNPFDDPHYLHRHIIKDREKRARKIEEDRKALIEAEENICWALVEVEKRHIPIARERRLEEEARKRIIEEDVSFLLSPRDVPVT